MHGSVESSLVVASNGTSREDSLSAIVFACSPRLFKILVWFGSVTIIETFQMFCSI